MIDHYLENGKKDLNLSGSMLAQADDLIEVDQPLQPEPSKNILYLRKNR